MGNTIPLTRGTAQGQTLGVTEEIPLPTLTLEEELI